MEGPHGVERRGQPGCPGALRGISASTSRTLPGMPSDVSVLLAHGAAALRRSTTTTAGCCERRTSAA